MLNKDQIWQIVKDLLHEHDCVIVPGFGGFVGNREPARIDQVSHLITPPAKRIVFNQNLKTNDGLLANRLAQKFQFTYVEALKTIDECVEQIKNTLQQHKAYEVNYFGNFRLNADANYVFLADKQNTYLPASFGLSPLQAEPVEARMAKVNKVRIFKEHRDTRRVRNKKKLWRNAVITVWVLMLGVNAAIFMQDHSLNDLRLGNSEMNITSWFDSLFNDSSDIQQTPETSETPALPETAQEEVETPPTPIDLTTTDTTAQPDITPTEELNNIVTETPENTNINVSEVPAETDINYYSYATNIALARKQWYFPQVPAVAEDIERSRNAEEIKEESTTTEELPAIIEPEGEKPDNNEPSNKKMPANKLAGKSASTDSLFYIIGGVFCQERNAVKYYNQLKGKGYEPELLLNKNMNCKRVSYASFHTRKEAEMMLMNIKTRENPAAWISCEKGKIKNHTRHVYM